MSFEIQPLAPEHAAAAAAIHAEGQERTFLTSLGPAFLRALYAQMASSAHCFGFVALDGGEIIGVVTGTVDSGAVFRELVLRRGLKLILPVAGAMLRVPSLVPKVLKTLAYPAQTRNSKGAKGTATKDTKGGAKGGPGEAELFFIGTRADRRGEGVGSALFHALAEEMRRRGMRAMGLIVDDENESAKRFYLRHGMRPLRTFPLYGRRMQWFELSLTGESGPENEHSIS